MVNGIKTDQYARAISSNGSGIIIKQKRLPRFWKSFLFKIVTRMGLEPMTPTLKVLCSTS